MPSRLNQVLIVSSTKMTGVNSPASSVQSAKPPQRRLASLASALGATTDLGTTSCVASVSAIGHTKAKHTILETGTEAREEVKLG